MRACVCVDVVQGDGVGAGVTGSQPVPGLAALRRRLEAVEKGLSTCRHAAASKSELSEVRAS